MEKNGMLFLKNGTYRTEKNAVPNPGNNKQTEDSEIIKRQRIDK